jgi:hypothetical protein
MVDYYERRAVNPAIAVVEKAGVSHLTNGKSG